MPPLPETAAPAVRTAVVPGTGPLVATLAFRVGVADETYPTSGITRRVAALAAPGDARDGSGGEAPRVTARLAVFRVTGTPGEVTAYLEHVASRLAALPAPPAAPVADAVIPEAPYSLAARRHGPAGAGLTGYPALAPGHLAPETLHAWVRTRFTRGNATLALTGGGAAEVPADALAALPDGPAPEARPADPDVLPGAPAYFHADDPELPAAMDGLVPDGPAAELLARILGGTYEPRGAGQAAITLTAPDTGDPLAVLDPGRFGPEDLAVPAADPDHGSEASAAPEVPDAHPGPAAPGLDEVRAAARAFRATALLRLPPGAAAPAGFAEAARFSPAPDADTLRDAATTRHRSLRDIDYRLLISPEAVTLSGPDGYRTVRFDRCVAMLARADGGRVLVGADGVRVVVEPTLYAMLTPERLALLDTGVDPGVVVPLLARAPDRIPRPPAPDEDERAVALRARRAARAPRKPSTARTVGMGVACVAAAAAALLAIRVTLQQMSAATPSYTVAAAFWVLFVGLLVVVRDLRGPKKDRTHIAKWWAPRK